MQADIRRILQKVLSNVVGPEEIATLLCRPVGGGSINTAYYITTKHNKPWFCKFNNVREFPELFIKESKGLALLRRQNLIRIPATVACEQVDDTQVLLLQWIGQGIRSAAFWRRFGEQLAQLHRVSAPTFGLDHDNYMGSLPQDNTPSGTWVEFFQTRRLEPQVRLATARGLLDTAAQPGFERLYRSLPELFPEEPPSLLHGDLWSGNFLCDESEQPVLIDPAIYYGHRSMDLAMTTLFGGFEPSFYEAYNWHYPFPPDYRQQWEVANLYPLLIHLNLFGDGGYLRNILHTIQHF
jgi:protein-ribulosamine 3-kinase